MNNSPLIRFHGYSNSWKNLKLKEHSKLITKGTTPKSKTIKGDINFIKVENLRSGKIFVSSKISENDHFSFLKRSILHEGDILFSIAGTLGRAAIVRKSILPANTNQALAIIRGYNFNSTFLLTALSGKVVREYVQKNPTVGAQPNLSLEQVGNLIISSPLIEEQNEIGIFFEKIDDIISLNQQELEALKQTKQGFLQKMFPRKGEMVPETRFTDFAGCWEMVILGDISNIVAGGDINKDKINKNGKFPVIANALTNEGIVGFYEDYYRIEGPAVSVTGRGDVGHAKARKYNFTPVVRLLSVKSDYDVKFLENVINNHKVIVESTGVPQLTAPQLSKYQIYIPSKKEAKKIGEFFSQLDKVIELKEQELEALKQTKKGFLQKMFV